MPFEGNFGNLKDMSRFVERRGREVIGTHLSCPVDSTKSSELRAQSASCIGQYRIPNTIGERMSVREREKEQQANTQESEYTKNQKHQTSYIGDASHAESMSISVYAACFGARSFLILRRVVDAVVSLHEICREV